MYYIARSHVSELGRHCRRWEAYLHLVAEVLGEVSEVLRGLSVSRKDPYLEANPPDIAKRTQNSRHGCCRSRSCAMTARRDVEVAAAERREMLGSKASDSDLASEGHPPTRRKTSYLDTSMYRICSDDTQTYGPLLEAHQEQRYSAVCRQEQSGAEALLQLIDRTSGNSTVDSSTLGQHHE